MSTTNRQVMHIVLFRWTDEATPQAVSAAMQALRDLGTKVPGILEISCGANFTDRGKGFTHGLVVRLTDQQALDDYGPHPEHQRVVTEHIMPIRADVLALDYEL